MLKKSLLSMIALGSLVLASACGSGSGSGNQEHLGSYRNLKGLCVNLELSPRSRSLSAQERSKVPSYTKTSCPLGFTYSSSSCSRAAMIGSCVVPENGSNGVFVVATLIFSPLATLDEARLACSAEGASFVAAP